MLAGRVQISLLAEFNQHCSYQVGSSGSGEEISKWQWSYDARFCIIERIIHSKQQLLFSNSLHLMISLLLLSPPTQHKLGQQDALTKQLRKRQKELKENSNALTNQKTNFMVCNVCVPCC